PATRSLFQPPCASRWPVPCSSRPPGRSVLSRKRGDRGGHAAGRLSMNRRRFGTWLVPIATCALVLLLAGAAGAEIPAVGVEGKVTWIAADKMVVAPPRGVPVPVDLSGVDLDQYRALREGDRVVVVGVVSPTRDRLLATSVQRLEA